MESKLKSTDLMIGDWVIDYKDRFVRVHGIEPTWNEIWVNYANGSGIYKSNVDFTKPIPLTPELLEKCGFVKKKVQFMLNVGGESTTYFEHEKGFIIWYHGPRLGYSLNKVIRNTINPECLVFNSLHQLQQLIRLITKQELIINL